MSNQDFERACLVHIERLQHGIGLYDGAMLATFCEAVRMVREYSDVARARGHVPVEYAWPTIADYEKDIGCQVNDAFRIGWDMARTRMAHIRAAISNKENDGHEDKRG